MIKARRLQRSFGGGLIAVEIKDLQQTWMQHADAVLADEAIISADPQALSHRHSNIRADLVVVQGRKMRVDTTVASGAISIIPLTTPCCPNCGAANCPVHDTEQTSWRHLNSFQNTRPTCMPVCTAPV